MNIKYILFGTVLAALIGVGIAYTDHNSGPFTPKRGTELRSNIMNALRPHAEAVFSAPVEFVVLDLRVAGDVAFAVVNPQRPGGVRIAFSETIFAQNGANESDFDGLRMDAFLRKDTQGAWRVTDHEFGATDLWYADRAFCEPYGAVLPDLCKS